MHICRYRHTANYVAATLHAIKNVYITIELIIIILYDIIRLF